MLSYKERRRAGLCVRCPKPARPNKSMCANCAKKALARLKAKRAEYIANGRCARCGAPQDKSGTECTKCCFARQARRKLYLKHREEVCSIPGCEYIYCDVHHLDGNHNNNSPDNLVTLCPNHHREVHLGKRTL